ncbi:hypothetical protein BDC45DRAFT_522610 [Circinella umbellata]|nr:hypothetical protein BDC45DRAFT_522610 [Circinella umbellata]
MVSQMTILSYSTDSVHKPVYATSSDSTPTPQASSSEATSSQKSSVTYIYDSSSISAPFKVKEKSASSVTVASSNCSTPALSWGSPPPLVHNQLLSRLSRRSGEYHHHHHHAPSTSSSKLHKHHNQWSFISQKHQEQQKEKENYYHNKEDEEIKRRKQKPRPHLQVEIDGPDEQEEGTDADIDEEYEYDHDRVEGVKIIKEGLPRNAKLYHSSSEHAEDEAANCLSSSLPLDTVPFQGSPTKRRSSNTSNNTTVIITKQPVLFQSSAPSSPAVRSRSQSNADRLSAKQSLRHMFSSFLQNNNNNDNSDDDSATTTVQDNEIKVMPRWIKIGHRLVLCFIILIHLGDGLCATIICRRDTADSHPTETIRDKTTYYSVARALRSSLQEQLQDFTTFLLTKEATHFTILSFITAYPGLLHFIHLKDGVMLAPRIVDLNEFNNNQGLLLEIGEKYHQWASSSSDHDQDESSSLPTWGWPSITKLHDLCEQMVRNNDQSHNRMYRTVQLDSSAGRGFQCIYQRDKYGDLLMGLYFSFIPKNVLMDMHQRLFLDVSQRLP